jgi:hypothetical protein
MIYLPTDLVKGSPPVVNYRKNSKKPWSRAGADAAGPSRKDKQKFKYQSGGSLFGVPLNAKINPQFYGALKDASDDYMVAYPDRAKEYKQWLNNVNSSFSDRKSQRKDSGLSNRKWLRSPEGKTWKKNNPHNVMPGGFMQGYAGRSGSHKDPTGNELDFHFGKPTRAVPSEFKRTLSNYGIGSSRKDAAHDSHLYFKGTKDNKIKTPRLDKFKIAGHHGIGLIRPGSDNKQRRTGRMPREGVDEIEAPALASTAPDLTSPGPETPKGFGRRGLAAKEAFSWYPKSSSTQTATTPSRLAKSAFPDIPDIYINSSDILFLRVGENR